MHRLFRSIRQGLIARNRVTNYLLYALGEIVLVVIGILIALIDAFISDRAECVDDAGEVVAQLEAGPLPDVHDFSRRCLHVYEWRRFTSVNYTVDELMYSGNLALISSEPIKVSLLRLQSLVKAAKDEENHFRFDSEELLYKPIYAQLDLHPQLLDFEGRPNALTARHFDAIRQDPRFKNGFLMVILEFTKMNEQLREMKGLCADLIAEINGELGGR